MTTEPVMDPTEEAPTAAAFGRWLRQERELRGLTSGEVAKLTHLTTSVVEGLESGDPARMPPAGYIFGYLRTYAGAVGLDADDLVLRWQEVVGAEPAAEAPRAHPGIAWQKPLAVAAAVIAAIAAGIWLAG